MSRKKWITLILCTVLTMTGTACGNGDADKVQDSENASVNETEQDTGEPAHGQDGVTEMDTQNDEGTEEEESVTDSNEEGSEEAAEAEEGKLEIGDAELEAIVEPYDKVFSTEVYTDGTSKIQSYFGYNVPDGWEWPSYRSWEDTDGRKERRTSDAWVNTNNSAETIYLGSFYSGITDYRYDQDGNKVEVPPDDYDNCYNEALHTFMETGKWEEPERAKQPRSSAMAYYTNMTKEGEIQTPYGKGVLYRCIAELVCYTGYDEKTGVYTEIDTSMHSWQIEEGMLIEVDNRFIRITYQLSDWISSDEELPDSLANGEYTGRLESIIPLMFEVK